MPVTRWLLLVGAMGLCLLIVRLWRPIPNRPGALRVEPARRVAHLRPGTPFESALQEAKEFWLRARVAAMNELDTWAESDGAGADGASTTLWRRGVLVRDRGGYLRRAWARARQAEALAPTRSEACRVAELLVPLGCDAGHHAEELRHAHRLVALQHGSLRSLRVLQRAAFCNGDTALARQAAAAAAAIEAKPATHSPQATGGSPPPRAPTENLATRLARSRGTLDVSTSAFGR